MQKVKVEKYVNDQLSDSFCVPLIVVRILDHCLPALARAKLSCSGIELMALLEASKQGCHYQTHIEVIEGGQRKSIKLTLVR